MRALDAETEGVDDHTWSTFLQKYSHVLLHVARARGSSYDAVMDRYEYMLSQLRKQNYRRLRAYRTDDKAQLVTWLFVVARRLCIDYERTRYGRAKPEPEEETPSQEVARSARRRLADLMVEQLTPEALPDSSPNPVDRVCQRETQEALEKALGSLSSEDQLLITLRFIDNISVREVTRLLRYRSPFQVYRKLKALLARLRATLEAEGISRP
jgi:RNA polymerase sigma factor (sigma-70 family)